MKFSVARFDPEAHSAFVFSEIRGAARKFPYALPGADATNLLLDVARRCIVSNPRGCVVAHDDANPDTYYGFVLSPGPQSVTFAYTKYALRHMGVMSGLLEALSIDPSQAIAVQIWSPAASRIAAKGWRIYPEVMERAKRERNERENAE